jgi:hypothetical protein
MSQQELGPVKSPQVINCSDPLTQRVTWRYYWDGGKSRTVFDLAPDLTTRSVKSVSQFSTTCTFQGAVGLHRASMLVHGLECVKRRSEAHLQRSTRRQPQQRDFACQLRRLQTQTTLVIPAIHARRLDVT